MKTQPIERVDYRGFAIPTSTGASSKIALTLPPLQPLSRLPMNAPNDGLRASTVLAGALARWNPKRLDLDGAHHPKRCLPNRDFRGFQRVCDTLSFPDSKHGPVGPETDVSITPDGLLLFTVSNGLEYTHLVSARMDVDGKLTKLSDRHCTTMPTAPVVSPHGIIVSDTRGGCSNFTLDAGVITDISIIDSHGPPMLLADGHVLCATDKGLLLGEAVSIGGISKLTSAPLDREDSLSGGITLRGDHVVVTNWQDVYTFAVGPRSLKRLHHLDLCPNEPWVRFFATQVAANGGAITGRLDTQELQGLSVSADGTLRKGTSLTLGGELAAGGPVIFGDIAVIAAGSALHTVRISPTGELTALGSFVTGGPIKARPTIMRDGTVLIGSGDGILYALTLGADGTLQERDRKDLGGPISGAVTVTPDGYILAGSTKGLFALAADQ